MIALDVCALSPNVKAHAARGIGRYVSELKKRLPEVFLFDSVALTNNNPISKIIDLLPAGKLTIRQQLLYPFYLNSLKDVSLIHFPAHMDAPSWSTIPTIVTVLDLIPFLFPDLYKPEQGGFRYNLARFLEKRGIKNAKRIIAISKTTAIDVERLLGIPQDKISVTHLGIGDEFFKGEPIRDYKIKYDLNPNAPVFLYVGGIDPRKNIERLLEAISKVEGTLLLAGKLDSEKSYPKIRELIDRLNLRSKVRLLGFVPDEELRGLIRSVDAFVFPSLYEGFGFPPLEAMAGGALVLSSNTSCMPEILGSEAPIYFDPTSTDSIVDSLRKVKSIGLEERKVRAERGVSQAKKFSWDETARLTMEAYEAA